MKYPNNPEKWLTISTFNNALADWFRQQVLEQILEGKVTREEVYELAKHLEKVFYKDRE